MSAPVPRVAVIGAGITGLAAALRLQDGAWQAGHPLEVLVLESQNRTGGKIRTLHHGDFLLEAGPDSFHAQGGNLPGLIHALGLDTQLVHGMTSQAYVCRDDRLLPIPRGMIMGVPTQLGPFLASPLLSAAGKLRITLEMLRWRHPAAEDESVADFFRRSFGSELVSRLVAPLFSAIYAEDIEYLSARVAVPRLVALQARQRSLILGLRRTRPRAAPAGTRRTAPFATLSQGLQSLTDAMAARLPAGCILRNTAVRHIRPNDAGQRLITDAGDSLDVDAVILATPSEAAAHLLDMTPDFAALHARAPASVASVVLGFAPGTLFTAAHGTGFVVAPGAARALSACTWSHLKWPHSAPRGHALLRCHVGRPGADAIVEAEDDVIVQAVLHDLGRIMALDARPAFHRVTRWQRAMPRYGVGHPAHVARLRQAVDRRFPGLQLAGAAYGGPGLSDCVREGEHAATTILEHLFAGASSFPTQPADGAAEAAGAPAGPTAFV